MSKYVCETIFLDPNLTEEDFKYICNTLSCSNKFSLSKRANANGVYKTYKLMFNVFYYDCNDLRKYLLTNDERRRLVHYIKREYSDIYSQCGINNKEQINKEWLPRVPKEKISSLLGSCIPFDNLLWKVLDIGFGGADYSGESECYLVTTTVRGLISSFSGVVDSIIAVDTGEQLLDNIHINFRIIAVCSCQQNIRRIFPYIYNVWNNGLNIFESIR